MAGSDAAGSLGASAIEPATDGSPRSVSRTIGVALAVNAVTSLPYMILGAAAVQVTNDLGFDEAALGVLLSLFAIGGLIASPVSGFLVDRVGPAQGLRVATIIAIATALAVAVLGRAWWAIAVIMLLGGTSSGMTSPAANLLITRVVPKERQGFALGMKQSAVPVTSIIAGLAIPLIVLTAGWRWAFVAVAVLAAGVLVSVPSGPKPAKLDRTRHRAAVRRWPLLVLTLGVLFAYLAQSPLQSFYVSSAVHRGMGEATAGVMLAVGGVTSLVVRIAIGMAADRRPRGFLRRVAFMLAAGGVSYVALATGSTVLIAVMTPVIFTTANGWTGLVHLAVVHSHPLAAASATGIMMLGAFGGTVMGPTLFGVVAARSYAIAWLVFGALFVIGAAVVLVARAMLRSSVAAEPHELNEPTVPIPGAPTTIA